MQLRNILPNDMAFGVIIRAFCDFRRQYASVVLNVGVRYGGAAHQCIVVIRLLVRFVFKIAKGIRREQLLMSRKAGHAC